MTIQVVPLIVVILYLLIMIAIGIIYTKQAGRSEDEFLVAGRSIPGFWGGMAIASDYTSAGTMVAGLGVTVAFAGLGLQLWAGPVIVIGFLLVAFTIGPQLRKGGYTTIPDYFNKFGGSVSLRGISAIIVIFIMVVYLVVQLKGIGLVGEYVLGIPYNTSVWLVGGTMVLYIVLGGMFSSVWNGVIQEFIMLGSVFILCILSIIKAGGLTQLIMGSAEKAPWFLTMEGKIGLGFPVTYGIIMMFIMLAMPSILIRAHASRTEVDARRTLIWGGFWTALFSIAWTITLIGVQYHVMPSKRPDMGFIALTSMIMPSGIMIGIALAALLAACMSTIGAQLIALSSSFSHDIYAKIIKREVEIPKTTLVWWTRIVSLIAGVVVIILTLNAPPIIAKMLLLAGSTAGACFMAPLYLGLYWSKVNKYAVGFAMVAGFATVIITNPLFKILPVNPEPWSGIIGVGVSTLVLIIVTLVTSKK